VARFVDIIGGHKLKLKKEPDELTESGRTRHIMKGEIIEVRGFEDTIVLRGVADTPDKASYDAYLSRAIERQEHIKDTGGYIRATITFSEPLEEHEAISIINQHQGFPGVAKVVDATEENTIFCPLPLDQGFVKTVESEIVRLACESEKKASFSFSPHIAAIYGLVPMSRVIDLQDVKEVLLVDLGPIDIRDEYLKFRKQVAVAPTLDLFHKHRKFS
jgi:hypothetical protein